MAMNLVVQELKLSPKMSLSIYTPTFRAIRLVSFDQGTFILELGWVIFKTYAEGLAQQLDSRIYHLSLAQLVFSICIAS